MTVRRIVFLFAIGFCLAALPARAAHTQVQLLLSANPARPGDMIWAAVDLKMDAGWHTYWKNPGESGIATTIKWDLPPGVTAGEIQWPLPEKLPPAEVTTYGYEHEVMLLVPLTLATNLTPGPLVLKADVSWLECMEQCVPGSASIEATLTIGSETKTSADAATIQSWQSKVPLAKNNFSLQAWWEPANDDTRPLNIGNPATETDKNFKYDSVDFFPGASDQFEVQSATEVISAYSGELYFRKFVKKFSGDWPKEISGVLVVQQNNSRSGYELKLPISNQFPAVTTGVVKKHCTNFARTRPALAIALENAALRLYRRIDFESDAVRAAGDCLEDSRLRQRGEK